MNDFFKNGGTKYLIGALSLIAICFFIYIFFDNKAKTNMTLVVERVPAQVRLLELKIDTDGFFANIQDVNTSEKFEQVFVSKLCPLSDKNQLGKVINISKIVLYKVKDDVKITTFEGLYEHLCTDKKDVTPNTEAVKK